MGIKITDKGKQHIKEKLDTLGMDVVKRIKDRRNGIENISTHGIMGYVYRNYREYLENALKKKMYKNLLDEPDVHDD